MSTKTTFKRIALVAVAALGFGTLSVVPSNAASQADTLSASTTATSTTVGSTVTTVLTQTYIATAVADEMNVTASLISAPAGAFALPVLSAAGGTDVNTTVNASNQLATVPSTNFAPTLTKGFITATLQPVVAGTYVIRFTPAVTAGGGILSATPITWTVTVAAKSASTAYGSTTRMIAAYSYYDGSNARATDGSVYASPHAAVTDSIASGVSKSSTACYSDATFTGSQCALIDVVLSNATEITANTLADGDALPITVSISGTGGGVVALATSHTVADGGYFKFEGVRGVAVYESSTVNPYAYTSRTKHIAVYTTGQTGTSTVTIKAGDVVVGTRTIVFYGNPAKIDTVTVVNSVIATSNANPVNAGAVTAYVKDALGNAVPGVTLYALSSATSVVANASAVTSSTGKATFTLTGGLEGTASLKITNQTSLTDTTTVALAGVSSVSVRVGSTTPASVSWALDATDYVPGSLAKLTVTLLDAAGLAVVDGEYPNVFAGASTSSLALTGGALPAGSVTTTASTGTASYSFNMPVSTGTVTIKNTTSTGLALANQAVAVSLTANVTGGQAAETAQAAADAAAEATDAANAATDAANAAAEAADAATAAAQDAADAVAALSTQVAEMIDALKKQITALTNLVIKIQKKVKA